MKLGLLTAALVFLASSALAQHQHNSNMATETGQSQFAAIAEIVTLLRDDPETDWGRVDIDALRNHLVDMDNVTTKAVVGTVVTDGDVTFNIQGDAAVAVSIQNMVLAHSPMLQQATDWAVLAEKTADGATMLIQTDSDAELKQITGLGFFGVMAIGAHHQHHHLMIAKGHSPH